MRDLIKWVRLRLDKSSADQTEADAKKTLGGIDGALGKLKGAAIALGSALAAAFAVNKIVDFVKASVDAAREAERQYSALANTIDASGESYRDLEADVLAAADAFEQATVHDDGAFAEGLQRMIALTGDTTASMNNMGLAADVAATFFNGELQPAVDLVSKAMVGQTATLQKMGIQAGSAQEALEILAERSMGAAAARASTLDGRIQQLNNGWGNFQKEVGFAITTSEGAGMAVQALGAAVQWLRRWVDENKDAISRWVTGGVKFAIDTADVLLRTLLGLGSILKGALNGALAAGALAISYLARGYAVAYEAAGKFLSLIGRSDWAENMQGSAEWMREQADALRDWAIAAAAAGNADLAAGLDRFKTRLFSSDQFTGAAAPSAGVGGSAPQVSRNARAEGDEEEAERVETQTDRVIKALEAYDRAMQTSRGMSELLGSDFDMLGSEAATLESTIQSLLENGLSPQDELLVMLRDRLREVRGEMEGIEEATRLEEEAMRAQAAAAGELAGALAAAAEGSLGPLAKSKAKMNLLEAAELTLRAGAAVLTGFGAAKAPAYLALAGKHAALAAAWGAAGAMFGGGSGGGGGVSAAGARATSGAAAGRVQPGNDVQIYLTGPGFNALNPEVQRVVRGAYEQSSERQGNARVRVITSGGR